MVRETGRGGRFGAAALWAGLATVALGAVAARGGSGILDAAPPWTDADIIATTKFDGFDVRGNGLAAWVNVDNVLRVYPLSGTLPDDLGAPDGYLAAWPGAFDGPYNSFVAFDPSGASLWVGFTVFGNTDDRIYEVDVSTGTWTHRATLTGNFELVFSGGVPYVSGQNCDPQDVFTAPNRIWRLDTSGADNHDLVAEVGGYAAGLGFDPDGALSYATNNAGGGNVLVRYTPAQVAAAAGPSSLALGDAEKLADLPGPAGDVCADGAGSVLFNLNRADGSRAVALWNGIAGTGANFRVIADGIPAAGFLTHLAAVGDTIREGEGALYAADWFASGVAVISPTADPVYRFWSSVLESHFYTISEAEKDLVVATWPEAWTFEGIAGFMHALAGTGRSPVYRFWSPVLECHFYTISEAEKDLVIATWPDTWSFEGTACWAYTTAGLGTSPVYRFWSSVLESHFYTMNEAEKDLIIATWPDTWSYEGTAWHAYD